MEPLSPLVVRNVIRWPVRGFSMRSPVRSMGAPVPFKKDDHGVRCRRRRRPTPDVVDAGARPPCRDRAKRATYSAAVADLRAQQVGVGPG